MILARGVILRCLLGLVLVLTLACADRAKQTMVLYGNGDYAGAARVADAALAQHPDDNDLWAWRIRAALALGDANGVATAYESYVGHRGGNDTELLHDLSTATLGQALASPSARLKIIAIEAIEEIQIHALADQVAQRLGDDDDRVAATAAVAVIHGYQPAAGVADDMMRSENAEARRIAVDGVGKKVGKIAVADLEKAGDDSDPRVRAAAIHWLGMLNDKDAVELCTKRLRRDPDDSVRAAAASALARIGLGNLEALAKIALKDKALAVRLAGIELLVAAPRVDELVVLANDPDPVVALQAAMAVKQSHPELGATAIARAIASDAPETRAAAANLLTQAIGKAAAIPIARRLAADKELVVRLAAARALVRAGDRDTARNVFAQALPELDAAAELADLGDATGTAELSKLVRDATRSSAERAAAAKAHRAGHHITAGLVAALADPNALVRVEAAAAIGALAK